jgi:hypothetical protein
MADQETLGYLSLNVPFWAALVDRLRRDSIPFLRLRA